MISKTIISIIAAALLSTGSIVAAAETNDTVYKNNTAVLTASVDNFELDHNKLTVIVMGEIFSPTGQYKASCHYVLRADGEMIHSKAYVFQKGLIFEKEVPAHPDKAKLICQEYDRAAFPKGFGFSFVTLNQASKYIETASAELLPEIISPMSPTSTRFPNFVSLILPQTEIKLEVRCKVIHKRIFVRNGPRVFGGKLPASSTDKICSYLNERYRDTGRVESSESTN